MSDKTVPLDTAHQALQIAQLEGQQNVLAVEVRQGMQSFRSALEAIQADTRITSNAVQELAGLQHSHDANNRSIEEVKSAVNKLGDRLEKWAEDFDRENREKWEKHDRERDKWRIAHEADNQKTKDRMILWSGVGFSFLLLGGAIVSGFVYFLNMRFGENDADVARVERAAEQSRSERTDMIKSIHAIELYIAESKGEKGK